MTDDPKEKKKVEIDAETKKELEKAPQVNERPGALDLPNAPPEKLLPLHSVKLWYINFTLNVLFYIFF